jgi:hypothetical protein
LILSILVIGCGGKALENDDGGNGNDGGNNGDSGPGPNCPASPPQGGACSIEGLECEYGNDIRSTCNTVLTCANGQWMMPKPYDPSCPTGPNSPSCPASPSAATGSCSDMGLACNYSTSSVTQFCTCSWMGGPPMQDGGNPAYWQCSFNTGPNCPSARPKIGASCSQPDLECNYDVCGAPQGLSFQCSAKTGTWIEGFGDVCAGAQ